MSSDAPVLKTTHGRSASGDQEVASCPTVPHAAARTQARTGFREGRDPPRRSGEGQPLRAFGSGRCVRTTRFVEGGAGWRRRECAGQGRRRRHHAAVPWQCPQSRSMAPGALSPGIRGRIRQPVRRCRRRQRGAGARGDRSVPGLGLVPAVRRHRRPAELERQQGEQDDGEEATHGQESSGYRVGTCRRQGDRAVGFHHFEARTRATLRFIAWRMTRSYSQRLRPDRLEPWRA
jgi:hypothetical protein